MGGDAERDLLTVLEAAQELGLSRRAIQDRIAAGTMRAIKVNARLQLIPRSEVDRFRDKGKLTPGPKPRSHDTDSV